MARPGTTLKSLCFGMSAAGVMFMGEIISLWSMHNVEEKVRSLQLILLLMPIRAWLFSWTVAILLGLRNADDGAQETVKMEPRHGRGWRVVQYLLVLVIWCVAAFSYLFFHEWLPRWR